MVSSAISKSIFKKLATRASSGPIGVKVAGGKWLAVGNMQMKLFFAGDERNLLTI
jgi:hypothetical protein